MAKRRQRVSPRIIYLACEGTETEYWYFKSLDESLDEDANVQLQIYPDQRDLEAMRKRGQKGVKTDHKSLCTIAAEKLGEEEGVREAWMVIDKDRHPGLELTFVEAAQKGVRIAFSSISFEHWLLLHFEKNDRAFEKSDCKTDSGAYVKCGSNQPKLPELDCKGEKCVAGWIRWKEHLPGFDKSNKYIFSSIQHLRAFAFENAAWLRWRKQADFANAQGQVFQINPYSNVDELLKSIYEDDEKIVWSKLGALAQTAEFELLVQKIGDDFQVQIRNTSDISQVLLPAQFFFSGEKAVKIDIEFSFPGNKPNLLILPGSTLDFILLSNAIPPEGCFLNFKNGKYRLVFEL